MVTKPKYCKNARSFPDDVHWGFKYYHRCRFPPAIEHAPRDDKKDVPSKAE